MNPTTTELNAAIARNQLEAQNIGGTPNTKFHRVYGKELTVALESTLDPNSDKELDVDRGLYGNNEHLIFRNGDCWRIYYPAIAEGDIRTDLEAVINFLPWFSGPEVLYNRLVLRARPITGSVYQYIMFARFGEEKAFAFSKDRPFINLDFFSKRNEKFLPLFVKVKTDNGGFTYFVLEAQWSEDAVTLKISVVAQSEVPPHLEAASP